jgi:hypothetical protein
MPVTDPPFDSPPYPVVALLLIRVAERRTGQT